MIEAYFKDDTKLKPTGRWIIINKDDESKMFIEHSDSVLFKFFKVSVFYSSEWVNSDEVYFSDIKIYLNNCKI